MGDGTEQAEDGLKPWKESALDALRFHWGDAYEIEVSGGKWRAKRLDGLGWGIAADYAVKPVPRDLGTRM